MLHNTLSIASKHSIRLVRGSHIVTKKLFDHDYAYIFQGGDGRIVFAIPYEKDYTLIGTTDIDHQHGLDIVECSEEEIIYLCEMVSQYFYTPVIPADVVHTYAGVRPLYNDGASEAKEATRDYLLSLEQSAGAPLLDVFGGKITTYRALAEAALHKICQFFPDAGSSWTQGVALPGGNLLLIPSSQSSTSTAQGTHFLTEAQCKDYYALTAQN